MPWRALAGGLRNFSRRRKTGPDYCPIGSRRHALQRHVAFRSVIVHQEVSQRQVVRIGLVEWAVVAHLQYEFALRALHVDLYHGTSPGERVVYGALGDVVEGFGNGSRNVDGRIDMQAQGARKTLARLARQAVQREPQPGPLDNRRVEF